MARLPLIDPAATSGDVRASFDRMPVVLNIFRMMAHAEANFIPAMRFANSILHRQKLSHVNRELLILLVAQREHGVYEWRQHVPIALGVGVTQKQIDCIEQGKYDDAAFNAAEQALLAFGGEVIENVRVAEPVFATMRAHFSEQEIVEFDPRDRLLHDDGAPDGGNRGRPRSRRRHDRLRGRQEAIGLKHTTIHVSGGHAALADAARDIAKQPLGSGQRGLRVSPRQSKRDLDVGLHAFLGQRPAMMDEPEAAIERCDRLHHRACKFVAAGGNAQAIEFGVEPREGIEIVRALGGFHSGGDLGELLPFGFAGSRGGGSHHQRLDRRGASRSASLLPPA